MQRWQWDLEQLETLLRQVEEAEREILRAVKCPTDPVAVWEILAGRRRAPWPPRTGDRAKARARHAMLALVLAGKVRGHATSLRRENARLAALEALRMGLLAGDAAIRGVAAARAIPSRRAGGRKRGRQISAKAAQHDPDVQKWARRWDQSDELQADYPKKVQFIRERTGLSRATVYRRLLKAR
jgi:hypothetical protein